MLSSLLDPRLPKSHLDILTLSLLGLQIALFTFVFTLSTSRAFFLCYFALWRLAYNAGLGWVLKRQSERRWIVKTVRRFGWMDPLVQPTTAKWVHSQLQSKMGDDYDSAGTPLEFNVWLLFRQVVDIILLNDFLAYFLFCAASIRFPPAHSSILHILRWISGWSLVAFNIWVKVDAHRIVHDFAWYWGDAFFLSLQNLVFDGVFEMAPHPMYSIGYAGFYGASLITGSQLVLFASLVAHMAQFSFLVYFENPHIERTYGQKKPLTAREPLIPRSTGEQIPAVTPTTSTGIPTGKTAAVPGMATSLPSISDRTPSQTEADSDSEDCSCPESEMSDFASLHPLRIRALHYTRHTHTKPRGDSVSSAVSGEGTPLPSARLHARTPKPLTRQDLDHRFFRKDLLIFRNFDLFRAKDLSIALVVFYTACAMLLPSDMSGGSHLVMIALNAVAWRCFHSFGLGWALRMQSERKWLVRHFLKRYHYDVQEGVGGVGPESKGAVEETFANWKSIYNLSLIMTYFSFGALAIKFYSVPKEWTLGAEALRHTLGLCLVALHVWSAQSTYDVLGDFGWFYGDFFIEEYPVQLAYTGIYRFLNNPERSMGGASFFGLVLISGSKVVLAVALFSVLSHWWFLSHVESPHMRKLYGDAIRKEAGLTKTIKNAAKRNAHRAPPELTKKMKEVQGTFEQIYEETAEALDDFLEKSAPRLSGVVRDTRVLLQQSGEKLIFTRVANDIAQYDTCQYKLSVEPSPFAPAPTDGSPHRFHLGEPITLNWTAPAHHARADWVGIYRCGANKSRLVTRVSSAGRWQPLHGDEWDGDIHIGSSTGSSKTRVPSQVESGKILFADKTLPWKTGLYEFRFHHDGRHNVMALTEGFKVFIEAPKDLTPNAVHETLTRIVAFSLGLERSLIPRSTYDALPALEAPPNSEPDTDEPGDPDDFTIMDQCQAKHIVYAMEQAFDVELGMQVVVADANVAKLATRVAAARQLLRPFSPVLQPPTPT